MIFAVTGGRYEPGTVTPVRVPAHQLWRFLQLADVLGISALATDCAIGTDRHIERFIEAALPTLPILRYPVNTATDGPWPLAGHRRNRRMLMDSKAEGLVAFPGGGVTANCVSQALSMGLMVWEWREGRAGEGQRDGSEGLGGFERIDPAKGPRYIHELPQPPA